MPYGAGTRVALCVGELKQQRSLSGVPMSVGPSSSTPTSSTRASSSPASAARTSELRRGAKGEKVRALQERLHAHGQADKVGRVDGDFGPKTASGLRSFQDQKVAEYDARMRGSTSIRGIEALSAEKASLVDERDRGVAGATTQRLLNRAPSAAPPSPTPALPPRAATDAVGGAPSSTAPQASPPPTAGPIPRRGLSDDARRSYTVKPGDTMSGIANKHDVALGDLVRANPQVKDPNVISVGESLTIPGARAPTSPSAQPPATGSGPSGPSAAAPSTTPASSTRPTLRRGASGGAVTDLQQKLNAAGHSVGTVDGQFGPKTETAVRSFQSEQGLSRDGVVGAKTWAALEGAAPGTAAPTNTLDASRKKKDELEANYRTAKTRARQPDLGRSKRSLGNHLEGDLIPKLESRLATMDRLSRANPEISRDIVPGLSQELKDARSLLNEVRAPSAGPNEGSAASPTPSGPDRITPPAPQEDAASVAGQLQPPRGFDVANPPNSFSATVAAPGGGPAFNVSVNASKATTLTPGGESQVTLDVSKRRALGAAVGGDVGAVGGEVGAFAGRDMSYSVTLPEAHYNKVLRGEAPFPNPGDLSTLPDGSSALVRAEDFASTSAGASLGAFNIGATNSTSKGTAVGLEVRGDNVRVLAGPTEAVTQSAELGLGFDIGSEKFGIGAKLTFGSSTTLRESELAFADISKTRGQDAYANFLKSGEVPAAGTPGVGEGGVIKQLDMSSSSSVGAEAQLGPLAIGGEFFSMNGGSGTRTDVQFNDGRREVSGFATRNGVGQYINAEYDAAGRKTASEGGLLLDGLGEATSGYIARAYGKGAPSEAQDAELTINAAQFRQLRERAFTSLEANGQYDDAQIQALRRGPDSDGLYRTPGGTTFAPSFQPFIGALVNNRSVDGFLADPSLSARGPSGLAEELLALRFSTGDTRLPGDLTLTPDKR